MYEHLAYYVAQAHTADLIREAERDRLAHGTVRQRRGPRTAIRRLLGSVQRGGGTDVRTASTAGGSC